MKEGVKVGHEAGGERGKRVYDGRFVGGFQEKIRGVARGAGKKRKER